MRRDAAEASGGLVAALCSSPVGRALNAMAAPNAFYIAHDKFDVRRWDIHAPWSTAFQRLCDYHGKALRRLDHLLGPSGLDFYMVWDLDRLPRTGRNVVVLLIGDERCQQPSYAGDVLAVFKTGATAPFQPYAGRRTRWTLKAGDALRTARDGALRLRRRGRTGARAGNVVALPLGYHQQIELPVRPFDERTTDIFFAGGRGAPVRRADVRTWQFRPRTLARTAMFEALDTAARRNPTWRCDIAPVTGDAPFYGPEDYSAHLMNARIALCPRGNFPETFRHFEAARAGAVIVSEPLPPTWYFEGLPAVIVGDWREAPAVLADLLSAPDNLAALQAKTLDWWRDVASADALARTMAAQIEALRTASMGRGNA